jgi:hypothetical protein
MDQMVAVLVHALHLPMEVEVVDRMAEVRQVVMSYQQAAQTVDVAQQQTTPVREQSRAEAEDVLALVETAEVTLIMAAAAAAAAGTVAEQVEQTGHLVVVEVLHTSER